eukprot:TRINITY_DN3087_c0_g2_i1.p1 TRINITY_DN3087_c0_g2~~TRINITY_DN3087_c0_g2_i1.p1  ORF type:complete len:481 (+),score=85.98 TRINITY_DN3087_c0_g2_i1:47-1444(+)
MEISIQGLEGHTETVDVPLDGKVSDLISTACRLFALPTCELLLDDGPLGHPDMPISGTGLASGDEVRVSLTSRMIATDTLRREGYHDPSDVRWLPGDSQELLRLLPLFARATSNKEKLFERAMMHGRTSTEAIACLLDEGCAVTSEVLRMASYTAPASLSLVVRTARDDVAAGRSPLSIFRPLLSSSCAHRSSADAVFNAEVPMDTPMGHGTTFLGAAAGCGITSAVKRLVVDPRLARLRPEPHRRSPVHQACIWHGTHARGGTGGEFRTSLLLLLGVEGEEDALVQRDADGEFPLQALLGAARETHPAQGVRLLLELGVPFTPEMCASGCSDPAFVTAAESLDVDLLSVLLCHAKEHWPRETFLEHHEKACLAAAGRAVQRDYRGVHRVLHELVTKESPGDSLLHDILEEAVACQKAKFLFGLDVALQLHERPNISEVLRGGLREAKLGRSRQKLRNLLAWGLH